MGSSSAGVLQRMVFGVNGVGWGWGAQRQRAARRGKSDGRFRLCPSRLMRIMARAMIIVVIVVAIILLVITMIAILTPSGKRW
jgi:hypothetical protein